MKRGPVWLMIMVFAAVALVASLPIHGAESFQPVRAPSKGADEAPVQIIEIADFM